TAKARRTVLARMHEKSRRSEDRRLDCRRVSEKLANRNYREARLSSGCSHARYERLQVLAANRILQLRKRLGFNLSHTLARTLEDPANFFQRIRVTIGQAVAKPDDFPFAKGQRLQKLFNPLTEQAVVSQLVRGFGALVRDEFAEATIVAFANRPIQADWVATDIEHAFGLFDRHTRFQSRFLGR